jgi:LmbE family N-acetylglucosaminyl deacetylase
MRNLFVVAHCDDETLSSGGTIHKLSHSDGYCGVLFCLAKRVHNLKDEKAAATSRIRAVLACKELGVMPSLLFFGGCEDEQVQNSDQFIALISSIENVLRKLQPDRVYTHWSEDFNQDHRRVSQAVEIATRRLPLDLIEFEVPSASELTPRTFSPNLFTCLDITDVSAKMRAISAYGDEMNAFRGKKQVEAYLRFRGLSIQAKYAEAFRILRMRA